MPPGSIDAVYGRWILMYLSESAVRGLVERMVAWLRPGGCCILSEFCNYLHIQVQPPMVHLPAIAEAMMRAVDAGSRTRRSATSCRACSTPLDSRLSFM